MDGSTTGQLIKYYRKRRKLTQNELAQKIGHANNAIVSKYENGQIRPSIDVLTKISAALNVPVLALISTADLSAILEQLEPDESAENSVCDMYEEIIDDLKKRLEVETAKKLALLGELPEDVQKDVDRLLKIFVSASQAERKKFFDLVCIITDSAKLKRD